MDLAEHITEIKTRSANQIPYLQNKENTKNWLVLPAIHALGYDIFNFDEVITQSTGGADYNLRINGRSEILVQILPAAEIPALNETHLTLFQTSGAKFLLLTNGIHYQFYTDSLQAGVLDPTEILGLDLNQEDPTTSLLHKFSRNLYHRDTILGEIAPTSKPNIPTNVTIPPLSLEELRLQLETTTQTAAGNPEPAIETSVTNQKTVIAKTSEPVATNPESEELPQPANEIIVNFNDDEDENKKDEDNEQKATKTTHNPEPIADAAAPENEQAPYNHETAFHYEAEPDYQSKLVNWFKRELTAPGEAFARFLAEQIKLPADDQEEFDDALAIAGKTYLTQVIIGGLLATLDTHNFKPQTSFTVANQPATVAEVTEIPALPEPPIPVDEEEQALRNIQALLALHIHGSRIVRRDNQTYTGILIDDNNRKTLCRLYLRGGKQTISFLNAERKEIRHPLNGIAGIADYEPQLKEALENNGVTLQELTPTTENDADEASEHPEETAE